MENDDEDPDKQDKYPSEAQKQPFNREKEFMPIMQQHICEGGCHGWSRIWRHVQRAYCDVLKLKDLVRFGIERGGGLEEANGKRLMFMKYAKGKAPCRP